MFRKIAGGAATAALLLTVPLAPLSAQRDSLNTEDAIAATKQMYGPPPPTTSCAKSKEEQSESEIVVCAKTTDDSQFRVKSSAELDPDSEAALKDGVPRAPDVSGDGIFKGKATASKLCLVGGCPPPPAYIFDLSELPPPPDGSDADRMAKGEIPAA